MSALVQSIMPVLTVAALTDVKPAPKVNAAFHGLVSAVLRNPLLHRNALARVAAPHLRAKCARAEFALEAYWAERVLEAKCSHEELKDFPYWNNYERLTALEWRAIAKRRPGASHIVFLGAGPLPATALILAKRYGCFVTLVDYSAQAVVLARRLVHALGLSAQIDVIHAHAETFTDFANVDVVYVAALVGRTFGIEERLYTHLAQHVSPSTLLLARSAHGSRQLLYRPMSNIVDRFFSRIAEVHPHDDVVNSVVLLKPYA
jgi:nicotianamine synthase